ncbi:MAG: polynucleotide adenylyltransferase PcnB [Gammaproteobacteria bacterium]|nr:polynucleotide adenylyltransferase PcnB [Gammaproteobacteria bacterium]
MIEDKLPDNVTALPLRPVIVPRDAHCISRRDISDEALRVLYRLRNAGYKAFLVGGGVRDLLLGMHPKDFDVATDARPEQVRELFRNCRLIGRRFRLAHVYFSDHVIEVATFRAEDTDGEGDGNDRVIHEGRIVRDNVYGDIDDDVWRRDFTVNALYYNIADFSVVDYVGGMHDIAARSLRLIGDPVERYREDPVRMLRAVRFAAKLGFHIDPASAAPILEYGQLLEHIPGARLFEELLKLFMSTSARDSFRGLVEYRLFERLFPQTWECLQGDRDGRARRMIDLVLEATESRMAEGKPVNPAFLFAAFLWPPMRDLADEYIGHGLPAFDALQRAGDAVISQEVGRVVLPRRITRVTREIWELQPRLERCAAARAGRLVENPRFRAAYDFLLLRAAAGEPVAERAEWWTRFQSAEPGARAELRPVGDDARPPSRRRGRRGGRRRRRVEAPAE